MTAIPKRLSHIWIGPKPAPVRWMETWPKAHPDWSYTVFGNETLTGYPFRLRPLINEYAWRGAWAGVQDLMRYELLFRFGGFMADADAVCLHPVDELLDAPRAYTVHDRLEGDPFRGVCPILACEPGNAFVGAVIDRLAGLAPWELQKPEVSTGNRFLMRMIRQLAPSEEQLRIWPTHYFVPWQKSAPDVWYDGPDRIYAEQKWGTSTWAYNRADGPSDEVVGPEELVRRTADILDRLALAQGRTRGPLPDRDSDRVRAAVAMQARVADSLRDPRTVDDFEDLGRTLAAAMDAAGLSPRFQGLHFYRHMQGAPLAGGKLRTRSSRLRAELLGWLGSARHALVIGYDTGHLIAAALRLNPDLRISATDAGRWPMEKDPDPPLRGAYVSTAADWLSRRFGDRLTVRAEPEHVFLGGAAAEAAPAGGYDMILFSDVDLRAAGALMAARPLLSPDAVIVAASPLNAGALRFSDRLRVQHAVYPPMVQIDLGRERGSLSVMRLSDQDA